MISNAQRRDIAIGIAKAAGAFARERFLNRAALTFETKGAQDYVSEADRDTETLIRTQLAQALPGDAFLGEEHGGAREGAMWVVDPIDGTINFLHGVRYWCISIAFWDGQDAAVGVIYDPMADECFAAAKGEGAQLNGKPLRVSDCADPRRAMICHGYVDRHDRNQFFRDRNAMLNAGFAVKDMGAGALMLAHVAAGRYEAFCEDHMHPWDALAGLCLLRESGGRMLPYPARVSDLHAGGQMIAAAPGVYAALHDILKRP
jgi:myo-inositol-1(or 4)-monophosphatase